MHLADGRERGPRMEGWRLLFQDHGRPRGLFASWVSGPASATREGGAVSARRGRRGDGHDNSRPHVLGARLAAAAAAPSRRGRAELPRGARGSCARIPGGPQHCSPGRAGLRLALPRLPPRLTALLLGLGKRARPAEGASARARAPATLPREASGDSRGPGRRGGGGGGPGLLTWRGG